MKKKDKHRKSKRKKRGKIKGKQMMKKQKLKVEWCVNKSERLKEKHVE